jgi:hypothetical protein
MSNSLDDIPGTCLTLCTDHGSSLADTTESLAQILAAADKWNAEAVLLDVVSMVGWGEDLGFVNVINANGFEDLNSD